MTERLIGETGSRKRRRFTLLPLAALLGLLLLMVASQAIAADPDAGAYTIINDENGANDVPGQKDLTLQGTQYPSGGAAAGTVNVLWNWDEIGISGGNTLDACTLFDTDTPGNGKADVALCLTLGGQPLVKQATTIYTCGDDRVDRCSSPIAPSTPAISSCSFNANSETDPFGGPGVSNKLTGAAFPKDTRAKCTVNLAEINSSVAVLINTCSYPSQQPNSAPSDCVLIPRDAFLKIIKDAGGDTQQPFSFSVSGGTTVTQNVLGSTASVDNSATIAIKSAVATSVTETLPNANWAFTSAVCTGGTNNGTATSNAAGPFGRTGVTAASDTTVTCTFTNALKAPPVITINKVCTPGAHAASDRFQPVDEAPTPDVNAGSELACNTGTTTYSPTPDTAFTIREVAGSSGSLSNYTSSFSAGCTSATGLARGVNGTCTITNTLKAGPVITINKVCTPGAHAASDRFQPVDEAPTPDVNAGSELACNTGTTTYSPAPDTAFTIREVAGSSGSLSNYTSSFSAGCTSATGLARGVNGTCTITNTLKAGPVITINKVCTPGAHAASDRFQPVDEAPTPDVNAGSELACNTGTTTYSPTPDTAFTIREVAGSSGSLSNYTSSFSAGCTSATGLARGVNGTCTITNTLRTFTVVTYVCEGGQLYASSVTFNGSTSTSLAHNAALPGTVTEADLCSATMAARFPGTKSGANIGGSVTITP